MGTEKRKMAVGICRHALVMSLGLLVILQSLALVYLLSQSLPAENDDSHSADSLLERCAPAQSTIDPVVSQRISSAADDSKQASVSGATTDQVIDASDRIWFDGDLNEYYNKLERDEHSKRRPNIITTYAVHRWMGKKRSTLEHYHLIRAAIHDTLNPTDYTSSNSKTDTDAGRNTGSPFRVLDAGCGLGAGLMWMEQQEPTWKLVGRTISSDQHKWIVEDLPAHKFKVELQSYDELDDLTLDAIYSIEALIHTPDLSKTLKVWSDHLAPGGVVVVIDDFLTVGASREDEGMDLFAKSWLANSLVTTLEFSSVARKVGMDVIQDRDLITEYNIIELNYRNKAPKIEKKAEHQGWLGSAMRQALTVNGKLTYRMLVLRKRGGEPKSQVDSSSCAAVEVANSKTPKFNSTVQAELRTGRGKNEKMACISGWYCCNKGAAMWDDLEANRTTSSDFLKLPRDVFGHYVDSFVQHLNDFYQTLPASTTGTFLDIGGAGSVASGMTQVSTKFSHWAGPFKYWVLDSDPSAKRLTNAVVCDIDDCAEAKDCSYDVTFSHTVLEHAARPWKTFDTIARITKKGGLTLHLVPWSYQYHATPDDNYRFSHTALRSLLEDRGFQILDVGYDVCTKPERVLRKSKDEHFDVIWLTYVVARKI